MAKLYPPNISGTLPSFYKNSAGAVEITVPFSMNRTVSRSSVGGIVLRLKTAYTDIVLTEGLEGTSPNWQEAALSSTFTINSGVVLNRLHVGDYYKAQIAYKDSLGQIGYYSTVGMVKYTGRPSVEIVGFYNYMTNMNPTEYVGSYHNDDSTESVYQYKFTLYNQASEVLETSGWLTHNSYEDTETTSSIDTYNIKYALQKNITYRVQYSVITNNNLTVNSFKYLVMESDSIDAEIKATLEAKLNYDNACIDLSLIGKKNALGGEDAVTGVFVLQRASSLDNYATWTTISNFRLTGQLPSTFLFRDYTIEQGATYLYSVQQFNDSNIYSNRILSDEITAQFEDAYLYDGERQLKIRFNPKVSSFKTVVLESKKNTIGSKYPFIFRNGAVEYKEFPISGLISYMMDNDEFFLSRKEKLGVPHSYEFTTDITDENVMVERRFKLEVLDWLNNGKVKLFKSPTEGNYLVRLMNVSLTPNDTVSRMIHTFSCTAEEVAAFTDENLSIYNLINIGDITLGQMRWGTIVFSELYDEVATAHPDLDANDIAEYICNMDLMKGYGCYYLKITDATLGLNLSFDKLNLLIGITGQYEASFEEPLYNLHFVKNTYYSEDNNQIYKGMPGSLTYGILSTTQNKFDTVNKIDVYDITADWKQGENENILEEYQDVKHQVSRIYYMNFHKCEIEEVPDEATWQFFVDFQNGRIAADNYNHWFVKNDKEGLVSVPYDINEMQRKYGTIPFDEQILMPYVVYKIGDVYRKVEYTNNKWNVLKVDNYSTKIKYVGAWKNIYDKSGNIIDTIENDIKEFDVADRDMNIPELTSVPVKVSIGSGVYATFGLQVKEITYGLEISDAVLAKAKSEMDNAYIKWRAEANYMTRLTNIEVLTDSLIAYRGFRFAPVTNLDDAQWYLLQNNLYDRIQTDNIDSEHDKIVQQYYNDYIKKKTKYLAQLKEQLIATEKELAASGG